MSFLLLVFLFLVCQIDYPKLPWYGSSELSALLTGGVVLLIGLHAFWISRRVSWPLARDPSLREQLLARYERWRFIHQSAQFVLYGLALGVLGWGWAVREMRWGGQPLHCIELLTLLPFVAGQLLTRVFFYDADREVHAATHRLLDADPFAQNWLESRNASAPPFGGRWTYVAFQLRQRLALVFIPVVLLIAMKEVVRLFPQSWQQWQTEISIAGPMLLLGVFIAMPWLIRLMLGLKPLPAGVLRDRLKAAAGRLGFRCSDILLWNTRSGMANAMVIGPAPWLRYVVFTDRLIEEFPEDEVEAVFGHEVGHIRHHHMLFYLVFLTLSMAVLGMLADDYLLPWLGITAEMHNLAMFPIFGVVVGYIFLVFGPLSRRCERQADVFGCRAVSCSNPNCLTHFDQTTLMRGGKGLCATGIRTFIRALEKVAQVNGISRDRPGFLQSWQHSTIARRVAFLQGVLVDPRTEAAFQRRLRWIKWGMVLVLAGLLAGLLQVHERLN